MSQRPLAARFDDFDEADARRHIAYLDAQAASEFWQERKRASYELLDLRPGTAVLDVGCGTGNDVRAMAALVMPGGEAVGIDHSRALIEEAVRRSNGEAFTDFLVADASRLPFEVARFDAVRAERVLQHVPDPRTVLAEIARVARAGARIVAIEPDWETLALEADPRAVTEAVRRRWMSAIRQPRVGAQLADLLAAAGAVEVETRTHTRRFEALSVAEQQLSLIELAGGAAEDGEIEPDDAEAWLTDLRAREAGGRFAGSVTYVTARGLMPG